MKLVEAKRRAEQLERQVEQLGVELVGKLHLSMTIPSGLRLIAGIQHMSLTLGQCQAFT